MERLTKNDIGFIIKTTKLSLPEKIKYRVFNSKLRKTLHDLSYKMNLSVDSTTEDDRSLASFNMYLRDEEIHDISISIYLYRFKRLMNINPSSKDWVDRDISLLLQIDCVLHELRHVHQYNNRKRSNYLSYLFNSGNSLMKLEIDAERYSSYTILKNFNELSHYFGINITVDEYKNRLLKKNLYYWFKMAYK